jgi:DNA-directed RNA polymerase specialized sigma24 family protein
MVLDGTTKLDRGLIRWIARVASRNKWRVDMGYDDLVQEGMLCYVKCRNHYQGKIKDRRHFMALVQTAFKRRLMDLSDQKERQITVPFTELVPEAVSLEVLEATLLRQGASPATPPEIAQAAATFASLPSELKNLLLVVADDLPTFERKGKRGRRETTHEYHCRLVGADPNTTDLSLENIRHMMA